MQIVIFLAVSFLISVVLPENCPMEELEVTLLQRAVRLDLKSDSNIQKYTYGKYFREESGSFKNDDNSLWISQPNVKAPKKKRPAVFYFSPGGFCFPASGLSESNAFVQAVNQRGFVYVAVALRSLTLRYHYLSEGNVKPEEFVKSFDDGSMELQKVRTYDDDDMSWTLGYEEAMPKQAWDAVQALEFIISNADELGVDVHQIILTAVSAGTSIANYLTWVYWQRHQQRFTIKALGFKTPQLNYPMPPFAESTLRLFEEALLRGEEAKLADIVNVSDALFCNFFSNEACKASFCPMEYDFCNQEWNQKIESAICTQNASELRLRDVMNYIPWPAADQKSLRRFWYHQESIKMAHRKDVYVYALSMYNGTNIMEASHGAVFTEAYAKVLGDAGIPHVTYYTDVEGAKLGFSSGEKYACKQEVVELQEFAEMSRDYKNATQEYNYKSNFGWRSIWDSAPPEGLDDTWLQTTGEFIAFMCYALGVDCSE